MRVSKRFRTFTVSLWSSTRRICNGPAVGAPAGPWLEKKSSPGRKDAGIGGARIRTVIVVPKPDPQLSAAHSVFNLSLALLEGMEDARQKFTINPGSSIGNTNSQLSIIISRGKFNFAT